MAHHSLGGVDMASLFSPRPMSSHVGVHHGDFMGGGAAGGLGLPCCSHGGFLGGGGGGGSGAAGRVGLPCCNGGGGGRRDDDGERKERRLASNRESARRSRVRRRRQLDELSSLVAELRASNQRLVVELNRAAAMHAQVARENARLREEARALRERLGDGDVDGEEAGGRSAAAAEATTKPMD